MLWDGYPFLPWRHREGRAVQLAGRPNALGLLGAAGGIFGGGQLGGMIGESFHDDA
jgi:hypothetical protein